jgi:hypothetical protein
MTSISPSDKTSLINGLRALAGFLERTKEAPHCAEVMLVPITPENSTGDKHAVVCVDSEIITLKSEHGSIAVQRDFGPVTYKVTLAPRTGTGTGT